MCTSAKLPVRKGQPKYFLKARLIKWPRREMKEFHQCPQSSKSMVAKMMLQELMCLTCLLIQVTTVSWRPLKRTSRRWASQPCKSWTRSTLKPKLLDQGPIPQMKVVNKSRWVAKALVRAAIVTKNSSALQAIAVKALKTWKKKRASSPESKTLIWFTNLRLSSPKSPRKIDSNELKPRSRKCKKIIKSPTLTDKGENLSMLRRQRNESKASPASAALIWSKD